MTNSCKRLVGVLSLLLSSATYGHQTFLIADDYNLLSGKDNYLSLFNGTYYKSAYSITRKMSRDISIVMGGKRMSIDEVTDGRVDDVDKNPKLLGTYIGFVAAPEGTGLGGVAAHPDYIALPEELFRNYLEHDGIMDALKAFDESNKKSTIRERYTKHAKAIFQVGKKLTDDYQTVLGYKVEIVPQQNPGALGVGDEMSLQVLLDGKPLPNQLLYASYAAFKPDFDGLTAEGSKYTLRTDNNGRVNFTISHADKWFVQLIHMQKATETAIDYESNWSTLTFAVQP